MTESTAYAGKTLVIKVGWSINKDQESFIRVAMSLSEKSGEYKNCEPFISEIYIAKNAGTPLC